MFRSRFLIALPTAIAVSKCSPPLEGIDCKGGDLGIITQASSAAMCCDHCTENPSCGAWTFKSQSQQCYLKSKCAYLATDWTKSGITSGLPEKLPPPPPATCAEPSQGTGYTCKGEELGSHSVTQSGECCDLCKKTTGCLVYTFNQNEGRCYLKKNCPHKTADSACTTGWVPPLNIATVARYQVGRGAYNLEGYSCCGGGSTVLFYPKGKGPFHVVVYGHGAWGQVDGSDGWLETVASLGLIVVAPFQGKCGNCGSKFADDLLLALKGSRLGGTDLHPALGTADWSRTGIFGHSKGAKYAPAAAKKGKHSHNVTAVMSSCDVPNIKHQLNLTVPAMFTTGTLDKFNQGDAMRKYFAQVTSKHKVYVNLEDAYHMEVQEGMRLNVLTAQFLSCHVARNQEDCDVIYGDGPTSICKVNDYQECTVVAPTAPTPSPRPRPTPTPTPSSCAGEGEDPNDKKLPCCDGLTKVLKNWDGDGNYYYKCTATPAPTPRPTPSPKPTPRPTPSRRRRTTPTPMPTPSSCAREGEDPNDKKLPCCDGLKKVLKNWDGDGNYYYKCTATPTPTPRPTPRPTPSGDFHCCWSSCGSANQDCHKDPNHFCGVNQHNCEGCSGNWCPVRWLI